MNCFSCGALVPDMSGPTHPYMESSPGCWHVYGEILVRQFSDPRRCPSCRAARKLSSGGNGGGSYSSGGGYERAEREMFSATCSSCGREARVPFRPSGAKPVYCSDCFRSQPRSY